MIHAVLHGKEIIKKTTNLSSKHRGEDFFMSKIEISRICHKLSPAGMCLPIQVQIEWRKNLLTLHLSTMIKQVFFSLFAIWLIRQSHFSLFFGRMATIKHFDDSSVNNELQSRRNL
jgi:hypothetical protein